MKHAVVMMPVVLLAAACTHGQSATTLKAFAKGPYTTSADRAVVGIEVTIAKDDGSKTVHTGNGLLLRSDGFVLAPVGLLWPLDPGGDVSLSVVLRPGGKDEARCSVNRPYQPDRECGYAEVRAHEVHQPALRVLLPGTLKPGDPLLVVSSPWSAGKFGAPTMRSARFGGPPDAKTKPPAGMLLFSEPLEGVTSGAVVTGPNGMGVGIVPGDGGLVRAKGFLSFEYLNRATGVVVPVPMPDSIFDDEAVLKPQNAEPADTAAAAPPTSESAGKPHEKPRMDEMVQVPGGPVLLPEWKQRIEDGQRPDVASYNPFDELASTLVEMDGVRVACVAPFLIDRDEVTNARYLEFWKTLPEGDPRRAAYCPRGWSPVGPPFPGEIADVPVLGVSYEGALEYAHSQGKRLPTVYEWCLAALGPKGQSEPPEWLQKYVKDRLETWNRIGTAHLERARDHDVHLMFALGYDPIVSLLPWLCTLDEALPECRLSRDTIIGETETIRQKWHDPTHVLPVGSRDFDVSPYGARDMIMNTHERVVRRQTGPVPGADSFIFMDMNPLPFSTQLWYDPVAPNWWSDLPRIGQPVSRMYARAAYGPSAAEIVIDNNLWEAERLARPITPALVQTRGMDPVTARYADVLNPPLYVSEEPVYPDIFYRGDSDRGGWPGFSPDFGPTDAGPGALFPGTWPHPDPKAYDPYQTARKRMQVMTQARKLWGGAPRHFRTEIGWHIPLDQPSPISVTGPPRPSPVPGIPVMLWFVAPNGFRCAR